jgi:hypothetical protein
MPRTRTLKRSGFLPADVLTADIADDEDEEDSAFP